MAARVLFVTGKGGTGKSAVAAALADEAATRGRRVLLLRMPDGAPPDLAAPGSGTARRVPPKPPTAGVRIERILDDRRELERFLTRVLGLGVLARRLGRSRTFTAVASAAPGLRDLVALTAIAAEGASSRHLVVVDAPASGHAAPLLASAQRILELAPIGPVRREAERALVMLANPRAFCALLVTTPEELPISETRTLREDVRRAGVAASHVVVNGLWPQRLPTGDAERILGESASADAELHWATHRRQQQLVAALGAGDLSSIGFSFHDAALPAADVATLYERVAGAAS